MVQEIISYVIIGGAFGLVIVKSIKFFFASSKQKMKGSKCTSCQAGCTLKEVSPSNYGRNSKKEFDYYLETF